MGCFMRHLSLTFFVEFGFAVLIASIAFAEIPPVLQVEAKESISVPIVSNGKTVGETTIPTGTKLKVKGVKADKIALEYASKTIVVPIAKTNYAELLESLTKAEEERIAKVKALEEEKAQMEQRKAENLKRVTIENIVSEKMDDGTILYKSLRNCNFLFKKGITASSDVSLKDFSITPSIAQSDEVRFILTIRKHIVYSGPFRGGSPSKIKIHEREKYEYATINYTHAERNVVRENESFGIIDFSLVINEEQIKKIKAVLTQNVVYFTLTDSQYHSNEYEMSKDQVYALREMLMKYEELTSK